MVEFASGSSNRTFSKLIISIQNNENGYLEGIANNKYPFMRRQDLPKTFMPNGAIYIVSVKDFLKTKRLFTDKTISFEMSEEKSFDIDTKEDLNKCNDILNRNIN